MVGMTDTFDDFLAWKKEQQRKTNGVELSDVVPLTAPEPVRAVSHPVMVVSHEVLPVAEVPKDLIPPVGTTFAWRDVSFTVPTKRGITIIRGPAVPAKQILEKVAGFVSPGQILFVMGPSGAGKSTLLDALADRVKLPVDGVQWLNGEHKSESALRRVSKYVQQDDSIMGALTVAEVLRTAAALYVSDKAKRQPLIDATVEMMGLTRQLDTKVGDVFFRGLSGGQKRRLSIAIELLAQPSLLFLDEPTSGLDSAAAFSVMSSIRGIAKSIHTSFVITIHQPSQLLFELGDNLLLLSEGKQVYFGPISRVESHFNALGFACPPRASIAEWLLDMINRDFGNSSVVDRCIAGWPNSPAAGELSNALQELRVPSSVSHPAKNSLMGHYAVSQIGQTWALLRRGFVNSSRAPAVIWLRAAMYFMLSILIGTVWLLLGTSAKVINDINGVLFYTVAFMIFMSISVLPAYLEERNQFVRERANGSYSVAAYLLSHFLFEIPFIILLSLVCSSTIYWLVGLYPDPSRFFIFVANLFLSLLVAESYMVLISAVIPYFIVGIAAGAFLNGAYMCVMGYFIAFDSIGWWWKWMRYIAVHFYSYSNFMTNQYSGVTYTAYCPNATTYPCYINDVPGDSIVAYYDLENRIWVNFVVMIAMIIIIRVAAGLWLHFRVRGKK